MQANNARPAAAPSAPAVKKNKIRISKPKLRLIIVFAMSMALFVLLVGRLFFVSMCKGEEYSKMAQRQWTMNTSLRAQRGQIVDKSGNVLASSYTTYQVCVNPRAIDDDDRERQAYLLSTILELNYDTVYEKVCNIKYQQIKIKDQVEKETIELLSAQQFRGGVSFYPDVKRTYREGQLFAQLLGFTNVDGDGQTGLELTCNRELAGVDGKQIVETDRDNNPIHRGYQEYVDPVSGNNIHLTVDTGLQGFLEDALQKAAVINNAKNAHGLLMSPQTGEIFAVATYPSYDPNNPPRTDAAVLLELSKNRIATDTYEPGSIFKVITLAAALDSHAITTDTTFRCRGSMSVKGERISCWDSEGHGTESVAEATEKSCNLAYMSMALKMGTNTFYDYIYNFGFDAPTNSGLMGETSGTVTHRKYILDPDLARIGVGQSITTTGMQLAVAVSAAINGGHLMQPYIVDRIEDINGNVVQQNVPTLVRDVISADTSAKVRNLLMGVVDRGTGRNAQVAGYTVGGKTGTAFKYEEDGTLSATKVISSFVGFAPANNPQYLCLIVIDEPQIPSAFSRSAAAPFAQMVLQNALNYSGVTPNKNNESVIVPDLTNMPVDSAIQLLSDKHLNSTFIEEERQAFVIRQSPPAGTVVVKGSTVMLYTSWTGARAEQSEPVYVKMPDILGKNRMDAYDALKKAGLVMEFDLLNSSGVVTSVQYAEDEMVLLGSTVWVTFTYNPEE